MEDFELRTLAAEAATGDLEAAEQLVCAVHGHLFAFLHLLGIPACDIDDIAQNVALQMYRSLPSYDPLRPFMPWFKSIALNVRSNYWRSRMRRETKMESFRNYLAEESQQSPEPAGLLDAEKTRLNQCMQRLHQGLRDIIDLRYRKGLTSELIGKQIGLKAHTVRRQLSRARVFLHDCINSLQEGVA